MRLSKYISRLEEHSSINPITWVYGLGRSLIAFATLSILLINPSEYLFNEEALGVLRDSDFVINKWNFFALFPEGAITVSVWIAIVILFLAFLGLRPRFTGLLHFWIAFSFNNAATVTDGGDQIATILTFVLIPITLLDGRKSHWDASKDLRIEVKVLAHLLFKIFALQMAFIYFHTAVEKIYKIPEWREGTALYYIFQGNYFGMNDFFQSLFIGLISSEFVFFLTWSVLLSHLLLSYLLLLSRMRKKYFFLMGLSFHLGIAFFMGLYSFSLVMIGGLVIYLLPFDLQKEKISGYQIIRPLLQRFFSNLSESRGA